MIRALLITCLLAGAIKAGFAVASYAQDVKAQRIYILERGAR
jgi:hypothetical protein